MGLPQSGKTTVFNALTSAEGDIQAYRQEKAEPNLAVVDVMDERVTRVAQHHHVSRFLLGQRPVVQMMDLDQRRHCFLHYSFEHCKV